MSSAKTATQGSKARFSEALWFKKGEADANAAQARAEAASQGKDVEIEKSDCLPIEDRYRDDGSLSLSDAEKYSLKSGSTDMVPAFPKSAVGPQGEQVSERELIREMRRWRAWTAPAVLLLAMSVGALVAFLVW